MDVISERVYEILQKFHIKYKLDHEQFDKLSTYLTDLVYTVQDETFYEAAQLCIEFSEELEKTPKIGSLREAAANCAAHIHARRIHGREEKPSTRLSEFRGIAK